QAGFHGLVASVGLPTRALPELLLIKARLARVERKRGRSRNDQPTPREVPSLSQNLELFPIGNCAASALIDEEGRYVWACAPRVDGDPFFSSLLGGSQSTSPDAYGYWAVEVEGAVKASQTY